MEKRDFMIILTIVSAIGMAFYLSWIDSYCMEFVNQLAQIPMPVELINYSYLGDIRLFVNSTQACGISCWNHKMGWHSYALYANELEFARLNYFESWGNFETLFFDNFVIQLNDVDSYQRIYFLENHLLSEKQIDIIVNVFNSVKPPLFKGIYTGMAKF